MAMKYTKEQLVLEKRIALDGLPKRWRIMAKSVSWRLTAREFGEASWKQLPDAVDSHYRFIPVKVEVEEHHVDVYANRKDGHMGKAPHPNALLHRSLVSSSLATAIMNGKKGS